MAKYFLAFCQIMEERHGRSLCSYPRRDWRSVCLPCSPGGGWFLSPSLNLAAYYVTVAFIAFVNMILFAAAIFAKE